MIIDDSAEMRVFLRRLLRDVASEIIDYGDGLDAIADFKNERPDWSVVDVVMPTLDGLAVTSWIKSRYPETRVVVITQHDNPKLMSRAHAIGATTFLRKEDLTQLPALIASSGTQVPWKPETP